MECPNCGKPMRIIREETKGQWGRIWRCSDWFKLSASSCLTTIAIPNDECLSIATISEDMARQAFSNSHEQGKKQAGYRRIAGSLNKLRDGREYLSDDELKLLRDAAEVLERLGTAAEKAKKYKKRLEEEEKRRLAQREQEAITLCRDIFDNSDLIELTVTTLTLAALDNTPTPLCKADVERVFKDAGTGLIKDAITNLVTYEYNEVIRSIVGTIGYRNTPVSDLVEEVKRNHDARCQNIRSLNGSLFQEIERVIQIEESDNVARLKR